jgi:hypothetical protein
MSNKDLIKQHKILTLNMLPPQDDIVQNWKHFIQAAGLSEYVNGLIS